MASQQVPISSPIKGVIRAVNREGQPPESCWDAQNCLPYDRYGRKRLSQRAGLKKQFTTQLDTSFVQGMIEAPNIIYPPGVFPQPIGSITDLVDPFSFSTNGTVGPLTHSYPSFDVSVEWAWTFNVNQVWSGEITDPMSPSSWDGGTEFTFYWYSGTGTTYLIWVVDVGAHMDDGGSTVTIDSHFYRGNIAASPSGWVLLVSGPQYSNSFPGASTGSSSSIGLSIQIELSSTWFVQSDVPSVPGSQHVFHTTGITPIDFPELALLSAVTTNPTTGTNMTNCTQTITFEDTSI